MADADADEPQFSTLKERIAALNQQKNFNNNGAEPVRKAKPPPPPPPGRPAAATSNGGAANNGLSNGTAAAANGSAPQASPVVPQRPVGKARPAPPPLPRRDTQGSVNEAPQQEQKAAPPPLPSRTNTSLTAPQTAPPTLPRRTSQNLLNQRRGSASSEVSQRSTASNISQTQTISSVTSHGSDGRKVPPAYNPASLPPLPPSRREREANAQQEAAVKKPTTTSTYARTKPPLSSTKSAPAIDTKPATTPPPRRLPPQLPSRPAPKTQPSEQAEKPAPPPTLPARNPVQSQPQDPKPQRPTALQAAKITGFGSGKAAPKQPPTPEPQRETPRPQPPPIPSANGDAPPPIPLASRPSASQIDAANARAAARTEVPEDCWVCRDWSGPDNIAAQFPRDSLPRKDVVGHLAHGLCSPFPSYTDKARAIFTWFHHNIFYDTVAFFGNNVKHMTVEDTIFTGKAVCQGYAETYKAIANRAGLDCVVVGGHGKGFGHKALKKGERPPPPKPDGHAWNAVRIDGGRWQLLDACWGAGHICGDNNLYKQEFAPKQFTDPNEIFGERHFPKDPQHQFREDGRTITWEEYFIGRVQGETPTVYTTAHEEGILERSVEPVEKQIPVNSGQVVRFQFCKLCPHWRSETHGKGKAPLLLLAIHGVDGRKDDMIPVETDGYWHWVDVNARDLGAPGQTLQVAMITKINGQDARGISAKEYFAKKGKTSMAWTYVLKWELV